MIHVDHDWWKTLFDEVYLITDAPFVCHPVLSKREVDRLMPLLPAPRSARLLDLCGGQGRHALELGRRGYQHLTVLDYSDFLLHRGQQDADSAGLEVQFCQGDARDLPFPAASFDVVLLLTNSFGYFVDAADDRQVLTEVARVLTPNGRFLLDLIDHELALQHFVPVSWHEATDDIVVCWQRERHHDVIRVREMVLSKTKGLIRDRTYAERLYTPARLQTLLQHVGFDDITVQHGAFVYSPDETIDYGLAASRMLVQARRA